VVENYEHVFDSLDALLYLVDWLIDFASKFRPGLFDVLNFVDVEGARVRSKLVPKILVDLDLYLVLKYTEGMSKGVAVTGVGPVVQPGDTLESDSNIDNFDGELFTRAVVESLILHKHHVADFESANEVFNRWPKVASTSPNILDVGYFIRVDSERLSQPTMVELEALIFEKFVVVWQVENLNAKHDEARVMTASDADVI